MPAQYHQLSVPITLHGKAAETLMVKLEEARRMHVRAAEHALFEDGEPLRHELPCYVCQQREWEENNPLTGRWGDE